MPCRGVAPSYRRRSTSRPTRPREPHRKPGSCLRPPGCAALGGSFLLGGERLRSDDGSVTLVIITILPSLSMTIGPHMISIITIIVDVPTTNAGIAFDERLEKHPHPCRKRRHTGSEIGFD